MIAHLRGRLFSKQPGQAIVEAGGVGYDVVISIPTFTALPAEGAEVSLHIHTQVREDLLALYGFLDRNEKRLFERLITVTGVGPKLAVTILSGLNPERTVAAIRAQDHATLTHIPGVGKKLAERLVVELKDKLEEWPPRPQSSPPGPPPRTSSLLSPTLATSAPPRKRPSSPPSKKTSLSARTSTSFSAPPSK